MTTYDEEKAKYDRYLTETSGGHGSKMVEMCNTPLFTVKVRRAVDIRDDDKTEGEGTNDPELISVQNRANQNTIDSLSKALMLPQYALLGHHVGDHDEIGAREPIFMNTRAPNSFFICGSQGSGKSYTTASLLENCLLPDPNLGEVANPVAGVAFHFDRDDAISLAEVASLCSRAIKVQVLLSLSNYAKLMPAYHQLRGAKKMLTVKPLLFQDKNLNTDRMRKLMASSDPESAMPLYMEVILQILRDMSMKHEDFTMRKFEARIAERNFTPAQLAMLNMRLSLLKSFMSQGVPTEYRTTENVFDIAAGTLTVIDLSDPFLGADMACVLFDICLGLIKQNAPRDGIVVTLDEAHKYLNRSPAAADFTDGLLTTVREQRHNATRVIVSTQEPTIDERLLDLCSVSIVHRFNSPSWFSAIKDHLSGASSFMASADQQKDLLNSIIDLGTGESFVFSPTSFVCLADGQVKKLGSRSLKMRTRKRDGVDSGQSKLAGGDELVDVMGGLNMS